MKHTPPNPKQHKTMLINFFSDKLLFALLAILLSNFAFSQNQITGQLTEIGNKALPDASVLLLNSADSSLFKGQLSQDDGGFLITDIPAGNYLMRITMIGYADYFSTTFSTDGNNSSKQLGKIVLLENEAMLAAVEVVAKKPLYEQKIDRMLINVAASSINAGGNALQVLQRSPGVIVNKQANAIMMSGKSGVIIMINGKISQMPPEAIMQLLEGTSADQIERIELIHTPPSSFDAEGSAGIINIVMKQSADAGLNGGYNVNAGYGKREKYGAGINFNFRKGKVNMYGNYGYQFDHNPQRFENYRGLKRDNSFLETASNSTRSPDLATQNGQLGLDYQLSEKTVIGVQAAYFDRFWDMTAVNDIAYYTDRVVDSQIIMNTKEINKWTSFSGNLNFSHKFSKDRTLTVDGDYINYNIHNPSSYGIFKAGQTDTVGLRISKETPIQILVGKADFTQQISKDNMFEAGVKGTRSLFDNDVLVERGLQNVWTVDQSLSSIAHLSEDILAAYASFSFKVNDKNDVKFGLRYEYTQINLGTVEHPNLVNRKYGNWFPSAYYMHKFNENNNINFSYSRRIWRPGFTQLAPWLIYFDPTTVMGGNPALQPAYTHALRTDYTYKVLGITVEYNYESPSIRDVPFIDLATNTQVTRPENIGNTHTIFAMVNLPWEPKKWWSMRNSVFVAAQQFEFTYEGISLTIPAGFVGINANHTFTLPKKYSLELSANAITASYYGLTKYKSNNSINIGLQKDLGERWGKLSFGVNDIMQNNNWYATTDQPKLNLLVKSNYIQAERTFMLTWSNKFGNTKLRDARQRDGGAGDERRRL
jgi:Outer membrane protein beta-barrel family